MATPHLTSLGPCALWFPLEGLVLFKQVRSNDIGEPSRRIATSAKPGRDSAWYRQHAENQPSAEPKKLAQKAWSCFRGGIEQPQGFRGIGNCLLAPLFDSVRCDVSGLPPRSATFKSGWCSAECHKSLSSGVGGVGDELALASPLFGRLQRQNPPAQTRMQGAAAQHRVVLVQRPG